jgi:hypothetical protein
LEIDSGQTYPATHVFASTLTPAATQVLSLLTDEIVDSSTPDVFAQSTSTSNWDEYATRSHSLIAPPKNDTFSASDPAVKERTEESDSNLNFMWATVLSLLLAVVIFAYLEYREQNYAESSWERDWEKKTNFDE